MKDKPGVESKRGSDDVSHGISAVLVALLNHRYISCLGWIFWSRTLVLLHPTIYSTAHPKAGLFNLMHGVELARFPMVIIIALTMMETSPPKM